MAGAGFAGASAFGAPVIGVALAVGAKFKIGAAVSDLHAAAIIAEARGLPDEVKRINDMADSLIKSGGGLLQFANYLGMMSGEENAKNRLDEDGYQYGKDDDGSPIFNSAQTKYNSNLGSEPAATVIKKPSGPSTESLATRNAKAKRIAESTAAGIKAGASAETSAKAAAAGATSIRSGTPSTREETGNTSGAYNKGGLMTSKKKKKKKTKGK